MFRIPAFLLILFFLSSCGDSSVDIQELLPPADSPSADASSSSFASSSSSSAPSSSSSPFSDAPPPKIGGDLFVYAVDAVSGASISDAEFFLAASDSVPRVASGTGGAVYRNLPVGENYGVRVRASGYAGAVCDASIKIAAGQSGQSSPSAENATLKVPLRKLASSLRGSVFYQSVKNPYQTELSVAAGAKVSVHVLDGECSYERKAFGPATVDEDGFFSFDSLPEKAAYSLVAHDALLGGFLYSGVELSGILGTSGNAAVIPRIVYDVAQTAFGFQINSDSRASTEKGDALSFGFSEPVNVSLLRSGDLSVSKTDAARTPVAVDFAWGDSDKTLEISPAFGQWESGQSYEISLKLYSSLSSKIIDTALVFLVNEFFDMGKITVSGIKLDAAVNYNTGSVTLRWDYVENAEAYEIYAKSSAKFESIHSLVGEVTAKTADKVNTFFSLPTVNWFANGDSALILVAARNGKGKSAFGAPFLIKDNTPPWFTSGPYAIAPDTANYRIDATSYFNSSSAESVLPLNIGFSEPMDTSAVLSIDIPSLAPRPLTAELRWTNTTTLNISFKIGAGDLNDSEEPLKIPVTVSGLRDIAGNPVRATAVGARNWEDLLVLMHANGVPAP